MVGDQGCVQAGLHHYAYLVYPGKLGLGELSLGEVNDDLVTVVIDAFYLRR